MYMRCSLELRLFNISSCLLDTIRPAWSASSQFETFTEPHYVPIDIVFAPLAMKTPIGGVFNEDFFLSIFSFMRHACVV